MNGNEGFFKAQRQAEADRVEAEGLAEIRNGQEKVNRAKRLRAEDNPTTTDVELHELVGHMVSWVEDGKTMSGKVTRLDGHTPYGHPVRLDGQLSTLTRMFSDSYVVLS